MSTKLEELQTIEIVRYHDGLAKAVAKMWTDSKESWGGTGRTEQQVIEQQQASGNLDTFLAMVGNEVVGYCGFAIYKEDIGALYIPLLNVRPDYHGKKVGKLLLLHALERAINSEWPRLDLYTWAGNLKAVPLYKRCGFFWEDDDQSTHLMNFIPSVLNNLLLQHYLKNIDWYRDLQLEIEVKPDGEWKNNFTLYQYLWKKDQETVKVKFEKTGRGLSYIETDDFILELMLDNHELIEETEQKMYIHVHNKTSTPLKVDMKTHNKDRIQCSFTKSTIVEEKYTLEKPFVILKGDKPINGKTFPTISVEVLINGKTTLLQLGISPKSPISIEAKEPEHLLTKEMLTYVDLELKNNLEEDIQIQLKLPKNNQLLFHNEEISFSLKKDERKWIQIPAQVEELGYFQEVFEFYISRKDKPSLLFQQKISLGLKGIGYRFLLENETHWKLYNGTHSLSIDKADNSMNLLENSFIMYAPSFGKTFSNELAKIKPYKVEAELKDTSITMKQSFHSTEQAGMNIFVNVQLFAEGFIKRWITIECVNDHHQVVSLRETLYHDWRKVYIPMNDHIVSFDEMNVPAPVQINSKSIDGNWYFAADDQYPLGLTWDNKSKCSMDRWSIHIITENSAAQEIEISFPPVYISIGAYHNWKDFRILAEKGKKKRKEEIEELTLSLNKNNCIYDQQGNLVVELLHQKNTPLNGEINYFLNSNKVKNQHSISMEEGSSLFSIDKSILDLKKVNKWRVELLLPTKKVVLEDLLLVPSGEIKSKITKDNNHKVYSVSNGILSFKVSPEYYPGVYSLQVNGQEWLEHSFPEPTAKSWWNPWCGGIKNGPPELSLYSLLKETSTCDFIERKDNHQNIWSGLKVVTKIEKHPSWKGVQFAQYFLTMPGLPVFVTYVEVIQDGGRRMSEEYWHTNFFLTCNKEEKCELQLGKTMQNQIYKSAEEEQDIYLYDNTEFHISLNRDKMYYMTNESARNTEYYSNNDAIQMVTSQKCMRENGILHTKPNLVLFDNSEISPAILRKLRKLHF